MTAHASTAIPVRTQKELVLAQLARLRPEVIKPAAGAIPCAYCIPGGFYEQQWDWDGFFIACHLAGRTPPQPEYLKFWTLNVLASELPDGDVAACISPDGPNTGTRSLRLKPFLAQGAELAVRLSDDDSWVRPRYGDIVRLATRREATHYLTDYRLFVWTDAMESGADNNPAVTNDPLLAKTRAACDVNAFYYREYLALARLADRLGHAADHADFSKRACSLREAVETHLWDSATESYWNLDTATGEHIRRVTYSNFVPLWAGMASPARGAAMIGRYLWNPDHLLTPFGARTLSCQDPDYNNENIITPYSNWQGPVWPIANYFYFGALMRHGHGAEAAELVRRLGDLYLRDLAFCGSLHENYHAETGAPLAPSAAQSKNRREGGFVGWNLLLEDMYEMLDGRPDMLDPLAAFSPGI